MAEELNIILNELKVIRNYLIKIGPSRRQGKVLESKKQEANAVLLKYNQFLELYKDSKCKFSDKETSIINKICKEFDRTVSEIISLCTINTEEEQLSEMDSFQLKTALQLLPVMNDSIDNTKQLIESIEYYDSLLEKPACKIKLIQFVLKSRLSQHAKLLLSSKYNSVDELIKDMRKLLLPQKSYTAIQSKLERCKQNGKNITDYGKEISELFVDLTISQAGGDSNAYGVLKPLNEKLAIKRFSDGLRDRRLSTIIAARNFSSLTDAIQAAQDEDAPAQGTSAEIMGMYKQPFHSTRGSQRGYRGQRNFGARYRVQNAYGYQQRRQNQWQVPHGYHSNFYRNRHRGMRSRPYANRGQATGSKRSQVNVISEVSDDQVATSTSNNENLNHFFRD